MRRPALLAWITLASAAVWLPLAQAQIDAEAAEAEAAAETPAEPPVMNLEAMERAAERSWPESARTFATI